MPPSGRDAPTLRRRRLLEASASAGIIGLAGCLGDNGDDTTDVDPGDDGEEPDPDAWPDLSGHEVHLLTSEATQPFQELWDSLAVDFETATGARVNIEYAGIGGGYRERIIELQQAGMPPELAQSGVDEVSTWAPQGIIGDLTPAMEYFEEEWGEFPESRTVVHDGGHRVVPLHYNLNMYHYRDDIFDVGARTDPFETDELLDLIAENEGTDGMGGSWYPTQNEYCCKVYAHAHALRFGGQMMDSNNGEFEIVVDNEYIDEWTRMVEFRQDLADFGTTDTTGDCGTYSEQLANGLVYAQFYFGARPKQNSVAQEQPFAGDVRSLAEPVPSTGETGPTMGLFQGLTTFEGADNEAANEFVKFMLQPEYLIDYYMATPIHNAPPIPEIVESDAFQSGIEATLTDEWVESDYMNHLDFQGDVIPGPMESGELNPNYWDVFTSDGLWHIMFEALEEGTDAQTAVEEGADILRERLDELQ